LLQPYLRAVDSSGETALIYFDGQFSHAIRKGALLQAEPAITPAPYANGQISAREPDPRERELAEQVLQATHRLLHLDEPLAYARIDLIRDDEGSPRLLELELTEPSLFFAYAPGSSDRFAAYLASRLDAATVPARTASA
jgi:O-ureido-D-serine cyclo-ligase